MNICLISEKFPPETAKGGIGRYTDILARGLAKKGHNVHVVAGTRERSHINRRDGFTVHRIRVYNLQRALDSLYFSFRAYERINNMGLEFDIIEAPNHRAQGLFPALGFKTIVRCNTPSFKDDEIKGLKMKFPKGLEYLFRYKLEDLTCKLAEDLITDSELNKSVIKDKYDVSFRKVMPYAAESGERNIERNDEGCFRVLFVGRLDTRKNPEALLSAIEEIDAIEEKEDYVFDFAGSFSEVYLEKLKGEISREALDYSNFHGFISDDQLEHMYERADLLVAPSRYESFGLPAAEAIGRGTPVLVSDKAGVKEFIEAAGMEIKHDDPKDIANKIIRLKNDKELYNSLADATSRVYDKNFSATKFIERTSRIYRKICDDRTTSKN